MTGNYRNRAELRKNPRQPLHYTALILTGGKIPPRACAISDVSRSGARIVIDADNELADRFTLVLSRNGNTRRLCRVIWRTGTNVGVEFVNS
jgi:hypothetical protein